MTKRSSHHRQEGKWQRFSLGCALFLAIASVALLQTFVSMFLISHLPAQESMLFSQRFSSLVVSRNDRSQDAKQLDDTLWHNRYGLVHVLKTRFMQFQPDLVHLGKARLELFKTFTLPSVLHQTNQQFLWIIYTDPNLRSDLLNQLISLVQPYKNILLIGTNQNSKISFRKESFNGTLFSGNLQLWKDYQDAAQQRILIYSRLDADDSIYGDFVDQLQQQTDRALATTRTPDTLGIFRIFCPEHSLEWQYYSPEWITNNAEESSRGFLVGDEHPRWCLSAGLSLAFAVGSESNDIISVPHNKIYSTFPNCSDHQEFNCVDHIQPGTGGPCVLRARTPTSNGMKGVVHEDDDQKLELFWSDKQNSAWKMVEKFFHVDLNAVPKLVDILAQDIKPILKDALRGQCAGLGFSCKQSSTLRLKHLLQNISQADE